MSKFFNFSIIDKRYHLIISLLLLTIIGFFIRIYGISAWEFNSDEFWHVHVAAQNSYFDVFYWNLIKDGHPILPYWIWHFIYNHFGADELWLRLPSVIFGTLCIPISYTLGKNLFNSPRAGQFFAFFITFSALTIQQSQLVRGYSIALFFTILAINCVFSYKNTHNIKYLFGYLVTCFLSLISEYVLIILAPFLSLFLLYNIIQSSKNKILHLLIWGLTHLFLLLYLASFSHLLKTIGNLDFTQSPMFFTNYNDSLLFNIYLVIIFLFSYIMDMHLFSSIAAFGSSSYIAAKGIFLIVLFIISLYSLTSNRKKYILFFVAVFLLMLALHILGILPLSAPRRTMAFSLCLIGLFFIGFEKLLNTNNVFIQKTQFLHVVVMYSILVLFSYAVGSKHKSFYEFTDFYQTKGQIAKLNNFIDKKYQKDDVIILDWLSFIALHPENVKPFKEYSKFNIYKIKDRIYIVDNADYRTVTSPLNIVELKAIWSIFRKDKMPRNVWLVKMQQYSWFGYKIKNKKAEVTPTFLAHIPTMETKIKYKESLKEIKDSRVNLSTQIFKKANLKYIDRNKPFEKKESSNALYTFRLDADDFDKILSSTKTPPSEKEMQEKILNDNKVYKFINKTKKDLGKIIK